MKLKHRKVTQDFDIPVKLLIKNAVFFAEYLYIFFKKAIELSKFPSSLKPANVMSVFKKKLAETRKRTVDQLVFSQ